VPSISSSLGLALTLVSTVTLGVTWVLVELVLVDVVQLRASERVGSAVDRRAKSVPGRIDVGKETGENVGGLHDEQLSNVTHQVVTLLLL